MSQSNRDHMSDRETVVMQSQQQDAPNHHSDDSCEHDPWVLQIKMVGNETNQAHFNISLHPNDDISQLYHEITLVTDIPHQQQRLIYRGRLLPHWTNAASTPDLVPPNGDDDDDVRLHTHEKIPATMATTNTESQHVFPLNQKVRDIVGLMNGHAIHLVVRPPCTDDEPTTITADPVSTATSSSSSSSSSGSTSLLAALLGMGSSRTATNSANSQHPRRPATYRLTDDDWVRPDPGSLETVRQGLMTFHTLQQFHPATTTTCHDAIQPSPVPNRCGRHFYLGQWIDCRDTVNQWLEATVVSILYPRDIMHSYQNISTALSTSSDNMNSSNTSLLFQPTTDPAVAVTDFDGRRRLLLEPCTESESEECIDGEYYRRRSNNEHVQILHIHYNGWPVRWDEWIRSDSERIRVFRTRTRHRPTSVDELSPRQFASPNIDTVMPDAPYTYMTDSEPNDRSALLPELQRALELLQQRVATVSASGETTSARSTMSRTVTTSRMNHLPWLTGNGTNASDTTTLVTHHSNTIEPEPASVNPSRRLPPGLSREQKRKELETLASLLDRLGRVLIDTAPHVLALSDSIDQDDDEDDNNESQTEDADVDETELHDARPATNTLGGLLSLLNRDRRVGRGSVASGSNVALPSVVGDVEISTVASSSTTTTDVVVHPTEPSTEVASNVVCPDDDDEVEEILHNNAGGLEYMDPDFRDYATGLINTSHGDVRSTNASGNGSSSGSRRGSSSDDGTTSLLGAYLAAMSLGGIASISTSDREDGVGGGLGRLLRDRGTGSGGIDIHIHAVVTAPGLDGAIGFAALTGGGGTGGGAAFPVATPVNDPGTPANGANGGMGSMFPGSTSLRRGGSRRFRSTTTRTVDVAINEQPIVGETNTFDEDELDLFADLYSETPDPVNPNPTYLGSTATVVDGPDEENMENPESIVASSSSPGRLYRARSLRHVPPSGSSDNSSEQYQHSIARSNRNEQRSISNEQRQNSSLLRRIFRRPDGSH